ncbi:PAS domain-containing sensor histidine kinase [Desulfopila sp. IMCC35008]|uniref:hybrid sensor histidine kinase/response regulator n=1 Tax=Desulfopila sp. IMCC35008 TaxID=2653858 RepID=UPI0013D58899|nr:PAS domain-containing sensor histidine kinase [Desulfopila sp. IMCC35008]
MNKPTYQELEEKVRSLESQLGQQGIPKRANQAGDESSGIPSSLMRLMLDTVPDLIWAKDLDNRYLYTNQEICDTLLHCESMEQALGKNDLFFAERERTKGYQHTFGEICVDSDEIVKLSGQPGRFLEYGLVRGINLILDVHKAPFFDTDGNMIGTVGCGRDITREKIAEQALQNAVGIFHRIADDVAGIAIQGYDEERKVTLWNEASEQIYGYSRDEALGQKLEDLIIPDFMRDDVIRLHQRWIHFGEKIPAGELVLKRKDGKDVHVYSSHILQDTIAGKEMYCIDINLTPYHRAEEEKRALAEQLEQAHRLEAIGNLAGGIAHDFNNILAAITGYSELAMSEIPAGTNAGQSLDAVLKAADRASELVRQILTFSRKSNQEKKAIRIQPIVQEAMNMMRSSLPSSVDITSRLSLDNTLVLANPTAIHQVVVNLCTNALHAMNNQKGVLQVTLEKIQVTQEQIPRDWQADAGPYCLLKVADNGIGIDEETLKQIFVPYFTTKERGEGTGLGLSTVHGIINEHNGFIQLESLPGKGTVFEVFLPVLEQDHCTLLPKQEVLPLPTGKEHILLVDDEAALCRVGKSILSSLGYQVTAESDSGKALDLFTNNPDRFQLIISDQTMPGLTGAELARLVFNQRPDIPFILCTGYSSSISEEEALAMGISRYIEKPFSKQLLAENVRAALDEGSNKV